MAPPSYSMEAGNFPGKENVIGDSLSRVVDELEEGNDNDEDETKVHRVSVLLRRAMNNDEQTIAHRLNLVREDIMIPHKQYHWIIKAHNTIVGHHGVEKTLAKLDKLGKQWPERRAHVKLFVKNCPICQKGSFKIPNVVAHKFTCSTSEPFEQIAMDTIELQLSIDGYQGIMVVVLLANGSSFLCHPFANKTGYL